MRVRIARKVTLRGAKVELFACSCIPVPSKTQTPAHPHSHTHPAPWSLVRPVELTMCGDSREDELAPPQSHMSRTTPLLKRPFAQLGVPLTLLSARNTETGVMDREREEEARHTEGGSVV